MITNRRTIGITVIAIGVILLAVLIYLSFFAKNEPETEPVNTETPAVTGQLPPSGDNQESTTTPSDRPVDSQKYDISQEEEHQINQHDLSKLAQLFAERFGSYSNYSNYANFSDLKIFMTDTMKSWADKYVEELRSSSQGGVDYFGITTEAITSEVEAYNESSGSASILVTTQRRESTSQIDEGEAYMQKIQIGLKKVNGEWLIDKAYWQER